MDFVEVLRIRVSDNLDPESGWIIFGFVIHQTIVPADRIRHLRDVWFSGSGCLHSKLRAIDGSIGAVPTVEHRRTDRLTALNVKFNVILLVPHFD